LGIGCETDEDVDFSGNVNPDLNVTGNYEVKRTPKPGLTNFTITQTNNRIQAIDNTGVVYTGTTPGDIISIDIGGTPTVTTAITLQGTDPSGVVRTILLTSIVFNVEDPFSDPSVTTDLNNSVAIVGLAGTYTDTAGVNGALELVGNVLQPDITF
jgi:hypothetical protein